MDETIVESADTESAAAAAGADNTPDAGLSGTAAEPPAREQSVQPAPSEAERAPEGRRKKHNPFVRLLAGLAAFVFAAVVVLALWCAFSFFNRKAPLSVLPRDYAMYIHTDAAWDAVEPLIDLHASDMILSSPQFVEFRPSFMELRASPLRDNRWFKQLANRRIDAALYENGTGKQDFVSAVDMGVLSAFTRPAALFVPLLKIPGLSYVQSADGAYFEYRYGETVFYIAPCRNLVIASANLKLFIQAIKGMNDTYTAEEKKLLTERDGRPLRIVVDARKLVATVTAGNAVMERMNGLLSPDSLSVVSFGITDSDINLTARFPFSIPDSTDKTFSVLLQKQSGMPALLSRMPEVVQYYTLLNAGSLKELKESLFPLIPASQNADAQWSKASSMCRTVFSLSLEDILYSWTGSEFAVLGVEGQNEPVFAVQVEDEKQRAHVFEQVLSSIILKDDTSFVLGGVRLPKIQVPGYIQNVLRLFNVSLPEPYYMVQDGFIYFSESAESLSAIYTSARAGKRLSKHTNWQSVSNNQKPESTVSLYYNLEHSVPFFLRNKTEFSSVLQLYTLGRCDLRIQNGTLVCQLQAVARRSGDLRSVPGFPIALEGKVDAELQREPGSRAGAVFWTEDGRTVRALELSGMKMYKMQLPDVCTITAAAEVLKEKGVLWAVTSRGAVYLFNRQLAVVPGFPVMTGETPSARASAMGHSLIVPMEGGILCTVRDDGTVQNMTLPVNGSIKSAPGVLDDIAAVYDKGFTGSIFFVQNGSCLNAQEPLRVPGIAFGSPAMIRQGDVLYTAFITQAGNLYLWAGSTLVEGFPRKLSGVFYTNVTASGSYFYTLSADARLSRIGLDGSFSSVAIPWVSAKEAYITAADPDGTGIHNIYACTDGNVIYGFSENLELLSGFPLTGWGRPVFADVNSDRSADCFALSVDNKLHAWNLR